MPKQNERTAPGGRDVRIDEKNIEKCYQADASVPDIRPDPPDSGVFAN
jgi:hypothetical protein